MGSSPRNGSSSAGRQRLHRPQRRQVYVADCKRNQRRIPGFKRGLWIGSAKDGKVSALIPDPVPAKEGTDETAARNKEWPPTRTGTSMGRKSMRAS